MHLPILVKLSIIILQISYSKQGLRCNLKEINLPMTSDDFVPMTSEFSGFKLGHEKAFQPRKIICISSTVHTTLHVYIKMLLISIRITMISYIYLFCHNRIFPEDVGATVQPLAITFNLIQTCYLKITICCVTTACNYSLPPRSSNMKHDLCI